MATSDSLATRATFRNYTPSYDTEYANKCHCLSMPHSSVFFSDGSAYVLWVITEGPWIVWNWNAHSWEQCERLPVGMATAKVFIIFFLQGLGGIPSSKRSDTCEQKPPFTRLHIRTTSAVVLRKKQQQQIRERSQWGKMFFFCITHSQISVWMKHKGK